MFLTSTMYYVKFAIRDLRFEIYDLRFLDLGFQIEIFGSCSMLYVLVIPYKPSLYICKEVKQTRGKERGDGQTKARC